jgi:phosphatidylserine decarboxylase
MAKTLEEWVQQDVKQARAKPLKWLSEEYFFRDPCRPMFSDQEYFFSPADGIILYQCVISPEQPILNIKGRAYSLRDALQDSEFAQTCLVIGIFMTMYDVHINRIPYSGFLSFKPLDPICTFNYPMLGAERSLINELTIDHDHSTYLHCNQRMLNRIYSAELRQHYYVLQIADYDVDCITPFRLEQNAAVAQNQRFSQIRFGSQVELILPIGETQFETVQQTRAHVEAGVDPLVKVLRTRRPGKRFS